MKPRSHFASSAVQQVLPDTELLGYHFPAVKKPNAEERRRMCTAKRRYRSQGDALDAAMIAGVERRRAAYLCPICRRWHLTSR